MALMKYLVFIGIFLLADFQNAGYRWKEGPFGAGPSIFVKAVQCYEAESDKSVLPENTKMVICDQEGSFCHKTQTVSITKIGNETSSGIKFTWGCEQASQQWPVAGYYSCGNVIERTVGVTIVPPADSAWAYELGCTCCGDKCNDKQLDDDCNDIPDFDKKCYSFVSDVSESPIYPADRGSVIGVSETQSCYKISRKDASGKLTYEWGGVNMPITTCGNGAKADGAGVVNHICTCCGDNCNGADMNGVTVDSQLCEITTTTAVPVSVVTVTQTQATLSPPQEDNSAAVVGGILGTFLALACLVIAYLGYTLYKLKKGNSSGFASDQQPIYSK